MQADNWPGGHPLLPAALGGAGALTPLPNAQYACSRRFLAIPRGPRASFRTFWGSGAGAWTRLKKHTVAKQLA